MDEIRAPGARDDKCKQAGGDSGTLCNFVVRSWTDPPAPPAGAAVIGSFISNWIKLIITKASYLPITLCISFFSRFERKDTLLKLELQYTTNLPSECSFIARDVNTDKKGLILKGFRCS